MSERYVDPNSGAAMQPGGFVAHRASTPAPEAPTEQPQNDELADEPTVEPFVEEESFEEEPAEFEEDDEFVGDSEEAGGGYDELLSQGVSAVERYVAQHPEEKAAIIAAEQQRDRPRKGVLEL